MLYVIYWPANFLYKDIFYLSDDAGDLQAKTVYDPSDCDTAYSFWLGIAAEDIE